MLNRRLILAIVLFFTSLTIDSFANVCNTAEEIKSTPADTQNLEGWVLEFIDGRWWWVLYNSDNEIIDKIPVDF